MMSSKIAIIGRLLESLTLEPIDFADAVGGKLELRLDVYSTIVDGGVKFRVALLKLERYDVSPSGELEHTVDSVNIWVEDHLSAHICSTTFDDVASAIRGSMIYLGERLGLDVSFDSKNVLLGLSDDSCNGPQKNA